MGTQATRNLNVGVTAVGLLCLIAWAVLLRGKGEEVMVKVGHRWNEAEEEKLLAQLDAINRTLANSAKK
jgi:hypothetical protein